MPLIAPSLGGIAIKGSDDELSLDEVINFDHRAYPIHLVERVATMMLGDGKRCAEVEITIDVNIPTSKQSADMPAEPVV